jgi:hypothetical protein
MRRRRRTSLRVDLVLLNAQGQVFFVHTGSGNRSVSYVMGTENNFIGIKWPEREIDHSSLSSADVKNE